MYKISLVYFKSILRNRLYYFNATIETNVVVVSHDEENVHLWHKRLGYVSVRRLEELSKRKIIGYGKLDSFLFVIIAYLLR